MHDVDARLAALQSAQDCRLRAREQRDQWRFYREFHASDAARDARRGMLEQLRAACYQLRVAFGLTDAEPQAVTLPPMDVAADRAAIRTWLHGTLRSWTPGRRFDRAHRGA